MSVNFEYYKVFYYAAMYLNFTRAAEALYISQPTVTKEIQNLEKYLGCELFIRKGRKLELSEEGEILFRYVKRACHEIFAGEAYLSDMKGMNAGTVKLCTNHSGALALMEEIGDKFVAQYPKISILNTIAYSNRTLSSLERGLANIVFILKSHEESDEELSVSDRYGGNCRLELVHSYVDVPIVGKKLYETVKGVHSIESLKSYPIVIPERKSVYDYYIGLMRNGEGPLETDYVQTDMNARVALVAAGYGIGFFPPEFVEDRLKRGVVCEIKVEEALMSWDLYMVTWEGRRLSMAEQRFCDFVRAL